MSLGNPEGLQSLAKRSRMSVDRIEYHATADVALIGEIELGVLFVMAFWSGPSYQAFVKLTATINRLDPAAALRFVVIDIDGAQAFAEHPAFAAILCGYGETAWIRNGKIQATSGGGYNPNCFEPHMLSLLSLS